MQGTFVDSQRTDGPYADSELRFDYPASPVNLGFGWDTSAETGTKNSALLFKTAPNPQYQNVTFNMRSFEDQSSLMNALDLSASFQMKSIIGVNVSTKVAYASEVKTAFDRVYFVARALVINGAEFLVPSDDSEGRLMLRPWAVDLANKDMSEFKSKCGDGFVSGIVGGAELYAVVEITESSLYDRKQLNVDLSVSGGGADFTAALKQVSEKYSKDKDFHLTYQQSGGRGGSIPTDLEGLKVAISKLAQSASEAPKPFQVIVSKYDTAFNWPRGKSIEWQNDPYTNVSRQYSRLRSLWEAVGSMLENSDKLILDHGVTLQNLKDISEQLQDRVESLQMTIKSCLSSQGAKCEITLPDQISDYEYRVRLPVSKGSFAADQELVKYTADVARLPHELEVAKALVFQYYLAHHPGTHDVPVEFVENDAVVLDKKDELSNAHANLARLTQNRQADLKAAIAERWIMSANRQRSENPQDPGYLKPSAIDALVSRIVVT